MVCAEVEDEKERTAVVIRRTRASKQSPAQGGVFFVFLGEGPGCLGHCFGIHGSEVNAARTANSRHLGRTSFALAFDGQTM